MGMHEHLVSYFLDGSDEISPEFYGRVPEEKRHPPGADMHHLSIAFTSDHTMQTDVVPH